MIEFLNHNKELITFSLLDIWYFKNEQLLRFCNYSKVFSRLSCPGYWPVLQCHLLSLSALLTALQLQCSYISFSMLQSLSQHLVSHFTSDRSIILPSFLPSSLTASFPSFPFLPFSFLLFFFSSFPLVISPLLTFRSLLICHLLRDAFLI